MVSCGEAHRLILRRAEGTPLDRAEAAVLDRHLSGCAGCRAALEEQREVAMLLRTRPAEPVSAQFAARVAAALDEPAGVLALADWRVWTIRLAPAAVALGLAALLLSGSPAAAPVDLESWTVGNDATSPAVMLWDAGLTSDTLLQRMVVGEQTAARGSDGQ